MLRLAYVCLVLLGLLGPVAAQDEVREAAERYVKLDSIQKLLDFMLGPAFMEPFMAAMGGDKLTPERKAKIVTITTEEIAKQRPMIEAAMIEAAASVFTVEELESMIVYYGTGAGASVIGKMQSFNNAYLVRITPDLQSMQTTIEQRVRAIGSPP